MRLAPRTLVTEAVVWFGAAGGAVAWTAQLILGAESEETHCTPVGLHWGIDAKTYVVVATAAATAVTLAALLTSLYVLRETRRDGADRRGRIEFMAATGALADVLFLALILLGGVGATALGTCVQG